MSTSTAMEMALQAVSTVTLIKIAFTLGKAMQQIQHHEKRLDRLEDRS